MGMFDYVKCEFQLGEFPAGTVFQTYDFDNAMEDYIITSTKQLFYVRKKWDVDLKAEQLRIVEVGRELEEVLYHGIFLMHNRGTEFKVKFTDGLLESIEKYEQEFDTIRERFIGS